ncbi:MAG TPA: hypothetical protein VNW68_05000 [Candidatus Limnocylindria bacterium]|jgi:hypothetical protein|nr:hypothetical protein [Candidatus Limnocylindria bacterium]
MRVVAAKFPDRTRATRALGQLRRELPVDPRDVAIAPLGIPGKRSNGDTVLAGRFPDERRAELGRLVRDAGGEILADVDERLTKPWRRGAPR